MVGYNFCFCLLQAKHPAQDHYFDKGSQSLDCEPSPPAQRHLGSYNNLYDGSQSQPNHPTSMGGSLHAARKQGDSNHSLRGSDYHRSAAPPATIYQRAASTSPQRHHARRAPMSTGEDLSPRSPTGGGSLPTSPSGERFPSRAKHNHHSGRSGLEGGGGGGGGTLGRSGEGDRVSRPQPIRVMSPYVTTPPAPPSAGGSRQGFAPSPSPGRDGFTYSPASPSPATVVKDRARTYHPARSKSRESLNRSKDSVSQSREYLSRSREGLSNSEESLGRSREASVSSHHALANSVPAGGRLGSVGSQAGSSRGPLQSPRPGDVPDGQVHPPSFVQALQLTEAAEVRERESTQNSRLRRMRKESSRSVYDSATTYEASV